MITDRTITVPAAAVWPLVRALHAEMDRNIAEAAKLTPTVEFDAEFMGRYMPGTPYVTAAEMIAKERAEWLRNMGIVNQLQDLGMTDSGMSESWDAHVASHVRML